MRILFAARNYLGHGGAEESVRTLLSRLAGSHSVRVLCTGGGDDFMVEDGVRVHVVKMASTPPAYYWLALMRRMDWFKRVVSEHILDFEPDLVLTQLDFTPPVVDACRRHGVKSVVFARSYEHFCPDGFFRVDPFACSRGCWSCYTDLLKPFHYPFIRRTQSLHEDALRGAGLVLSNSGYMSRVVKKFSGVDSPVVPPFIDPERYRVSGSNGDCVAFFNPRREKGSGLVLKMAGGMPERRFMVAGDGEQGFRKKASLLPNVECVGMVDDVREVYSRSRIVVMPSVWPEPFGRVAVEAMVSGIPALVSGMGGLPDVVGDAGVVLDLNTGSWVEAVNRMFDDDPYYRELSSRCVERAKTYSLDRIVKDFTDAVSSRLGVVL
ncbi:MAG: glycosyltransferase family 4 protein [Candidatus Altiarchaeota archaeon]